MTLTPRLLQRLALTAALATTFAAAAAAPAPDASPAAAPPAAPSPAAATPNTAAPAGANPAAHPGGKPAVPPNMVTYYIVFLKRGPAWSPDTTPEVRAVLEGHMANIQRLWHEKKLVVAGPISDSGDIRGIFIFQAGSVEEARAMTETDPAIKAGRFVAEIHPWWVEKGVFPDAGTYCTSRIPAAPAHQD